MDPIIDIPRRRAPGRDSSVDAWRDYWFNKNHKIQYRGIDGKFYPASDWIHGKEIRVFCMPEVNETTVPYVVGGIQDLIQQIGLGFTIKYYQRDTTAIQPVRQSIKEDERIDGYLLSSILIAETWRNPPYGGKPHADVIITDKFLTLGNEHWGQSEFSCGYMVLALPNKRQKSLDFIRNIAKHEAGHLFGFQEHHNIIDVKGYNSAQDCNMNWQASTRFTCNKCADALTYFWKGIEHRTGEQFFR